MDTHTASANSQNEKAHFFIVEGLPLDWDWRTLKDTVRSGIEGNSPDPGWTTVKPVSAQQSFLSPNRRSKACKTGYFTIQKAEDVIPLFQHLLHQSATSGPWLIHYWDLHQQPPMLMHCNCAVVYKTADYCRALATATYTADIQTALESQYREQDAQFRAQTQQAQYQPHAQFGAYQTLAQQAQYQPYDQRAQYQPYDQQAQYQPYGQQAQYQPHGQLAQYQLASQPAPGQAQPVYAVDERGTPINTSHGVVQTELRTVLVRRIHYKATKEHLENQCRLGKIVPARVKMNIDPTGEFKGNATVLCTSTKDAIALAEWLNGREIKGKQLKADLATEKTTIDATSNPQIAVGSTGFAHPQGPGYTQ